MVEWRGVCVCVCVCVCSVCQCVQHRYICIYVSECWKSETERMQDRGRQKRNASTLRTPGRVGELQRHGRESEGERESESIIIGRSGGRSHLNKCNTQSPPSLPLLPPPPPPAFYMTSLGAGREIRLEQKSHLHGVLERLSPAALPIILSV